MEFSGTDFRLMMGPGVYVFLDKEGQPLYIGQGRNAIRRAAFSSEPFMQLIARVLLYPTKTIDDAITLEAILIRDLRPQYNRRQPHRKEHKIVDEQFPSPLSIAEDSSEPVNPDIANKEVRDSPPVE